MQWEDSIPSAGGFTSFLGITIGVFSFGAIDFGNSTVLKTITYV